MRETVPRGEVRPVEALAGEALDRVAHDVDESAERLARRGHRVQPFIAIACTFTFAPKGSLAAW